MYRALEKKAENVQAELRKNFKDVTSDMALLFTFFFLKVMCHIESL